MWDTWVPSLGGEDPLEKERAPYSSVPACIILWTAEPHGLQSMGSQSQTQLSTQACIVLYYSCIIHADAEGSVLEYLRLRF